MDSGKIIPGIRNLVGISTNNTAVKSTDKDARQNSQNKQKDSQQKRQPTEEEAQRALAVLAAMDSVTKNGLQLELVNEEGLYIIFVKDSHAQVLRGMRGSDILRLLDTKADKASTTNRGSILDSRI